MSLFETGDSDGFASLNKMFDDNLETSSIQDIELNHLIKLTIRGGWPGLLDPNVNAVIANKDYLDKICRVDSTRIDGKKRDPHKMSLLIKSLARNESTVVSDNSIIKDIKEYENEQISEATLSDYRKVLERLFIIRYQPAFNPYIRSSVRVGKTPKKRLADPSLAAAALGLTEKNAVDNLEYFGFIFESLCEHDLEIYAEHLGGKLYHYRDNSNNEIDAVVELPDGRWGAFEIKLGFNQVDKAAKNLLRLKKKFESEGRSPSVLCVICGMSVAAFKRPDGVFVVPITRLGP
jgi:predicted AAA+ superfamily ATPase